MALELEATEQALRPAVRARLLRGERVGRGLDPVALASVGQSFAVVEAGGGSDHHGGVFVRGGFVGAGSGVIDVDGAAAIAVDKSSTGAVYVVASSTSGKLWRIDARGAVVVVDVSAAIAGVFGVSAVSVGGGLTDVGSDEGSVVTVDRKGTVMARCDDVVGLGITGLVRLPHHLVALSALRHRVVVFDLDVDGAPVCTATRVEEFDGLLFSLVAREDGGVVDVVVSGVEDHPLDRRGGSFGYIDSFAYGLRFAGRDDVNGAVARVWETNLSEVGVVNGTALVEKDDLVLVAGKGSGKRAWLDRADGRVVTIADGAPGVVAAALVDEGSDDEALAFANVLDDTVVIDGVAVNVGDNVDGRTAREKLGERLVFTTMMAPQQSSSGPLSRFTCETCHVGGGGDGRVHDTGRKDDDGHAVTATTKPLWGLFENPPLFSRGLDRSVAVMVHAEFKVANRNSPQNPWFDVDGHSAAELRQSVLAFFASFDVPPNPRARTPETDVERHGERLFATRCLSCHAARVFADTRELESDLDVGDALSKGALVWASDDIVDTGVRPKVNPGGARPSSLRGIFRKTPLLTNGHARTLNDVVRRVRFDDDGVSHEGGAGRGFDDAEVDALVAFLRRL